MHEYDTVLKSLLQDPQNSILENITGAKITQWLNVELPDVTQTRVDLLGETADRQRLIGFEFQSANDKRLPLRMAEYSLRVYRLYERFPEQYVLYVGYPPMQMPSELACPDFLCRYKLIDIRDFNEDTLLDSPFDSDNILAILSNHRDRRETIRRILARIVKMEDSARDDAFKKLIILAGLRKLKDTILTEVKHMPITENIMDHEIIGPAIQKGELIVIRRQIAKRFGPLPTWADDRLATLSTTELEDLSLRLLDAEDLDQLFAS